MRILIEVIGWSAGLVILLAYGLLSTGRLDGRSMAYGDERRRVCGPHREQRLERCAAVGNTQRDLVDDRCLYVVAEARGALKAG